MVMKLVAVTGANGMIGRRIIQALLRQGCRVRALVFLAETDFKVDREVFIISDDSSAFNNYRDVEDLLITKLLLKGYPVPRIPMPSFLLGFLLKLVGKPQSNPLVKFSEQKIISLGFTKPVGFEIGLNKFVDWYNTNENT